MTADDQFARLVDPDAWTSSRAAGTKLIKRLPRVGELLAYRYSAWRVTDVRERADVDLPDNLVAAIAAGRCRRPADVELAHHVGPRLDGVDTIVAPYGTQWVWLYERFQTCSCHGHPWPCLDYDRDVLARTLANRARRQLAGARPGVCAACREQVTDQQKTIVFPEPSLIVPGAPGPTFHALRRECWLAARRYEEQLRLPVYPTATRLASCPGAAFLHENGLWFECTAGPGCTGLHGPFRRSKYTVGNCATRTYDLTKPGGLDTYHRPLSDCGYRGKGGFDCLGAETGPHQPSTMKGILF